MALGRPKQFPVRKLVPFDQARLDRIEEWRGRQRPIPAEAEAIRMLVDEGLASHAKREGTKRAAKPAPRKGEDSD